MLPCQSSLVVGFSYEYGVVGRHGHWQPAQPALLGAAPCYVPSLYCCVGCIRPDASTDTEYGVSYYVSYLTRKILLHPYKRGRVVSHRKGLVRCFPGAPALLLGRFRLGRNKAGAWGKGLQKIAILHSILLRTCSANVFPILERPTIQSGQ